jgi:outer membrane protein with beta-barrel domain
MKQLLMTVCGVCFILVSFAQINQNNWLIGGSGSYGILKYSLNTPSYLKSKTVQFSVNGGYFFLDKLAAGLRISYLLDNESGLASDSSYFNQTNREIDIAPFIRYYFFPNDQKLNLLADAGYNFGRIKNKNIDGYSKTAKNSYSFSAGPVYFITPDTALELTLNYQSQKEYFKTSLIKFNIGFQIHLSPDH